MQRSVTGRAGSIPHRTEVVLRVGVTALLTSRRLDGEFVVLVQMAGFVNRIEISVLFVLLAEEIDDARGRTAMCRASPGTPYETLAR